jgi:nitroreductase
MPPLSKPAVTDSPILDVIRARWSPRAFADRPVSEADLRTILSAAQWSASSFNEQPWRYLVARKADTGAFEQALGCLVEANRAWAHAAAVLMFAVGRTQFSRNDKANRVWLHDIGIASAQLTLQATALGIYVHQMAGIDVEAVRSTYQVPEPFEPATAIALGYPGDPDSLPENLRDAERSERERRPLEESVFAGRWGEPGL